MINDNDEVSWAYLLDPTFQFENTAGKPLTDGYIEVYIHGTRSKYYCASDFDGTLHPFKIPLDSLGSNIVLASPAHAYDVYVYNKFGSLIMSRYNIVPSTGDGTVIKDIVSIKSTDNTVQVNSSDQTNWDLSIKVTTDQVAQNTSDISDIKGNIDAIDTALSNKKDKQTALEYTGSATKTVKKITQNANGEMTVEFEDIDLPQEVPNVNVTSTDDSITVTESVDPLTNTKTFDLSVANEAEVEYARFIASNVTATATLIKTRGNIELNSNKIQLKKGSLYHFTIRGTYQVSTLSNTLQQLNFIEYSTFNNIAVNVDNSIADNQYFEFSFDVVANNDIAYPVTFTMSDDAKVSTLEIDVHSVVAGSVNGSGDNDKVAVDADAEPNYLENVLVSNSDLVSLVKVGNQLRVNVNTEYSSDPKLTTMDESQIDSATSNYGSYQLQSSATKLIWNDTDFTSYAWLNAKLYQMMRLSDAQGTIAKANIALCGTLGFSDPAPCFNIGIFDAVTGTLLGQSGLKYYGEDFNSDQELCTVDMIEESEGSLNIKRNFKYIIMIWTCGLQLAGLDRSTNYNYTYDFTLRQNLEGSISQPVWPDISALNTRASVIPYVSFGATSI